MKKTPPSFRPSIHNTTPLHTAKQALGTVTLKLKGEVHVSAAMNGFGGGSTMRWPFTIAEADIAPEGVPAGTTLPPRPVALPGLMVRVCVLVDAAVSVVAMRVMHVANHRLTQEGKRRNRRIKHTEDTRLITKSPSNIRPP